MAASRHTSVTTASSGPRAVLVVFIVADTITELPDEARGHLVVSGSHGGVFAAYEAARKHVGAVIFNDAGIGKDEAGIAGLWALDVSGVPAAAVDYRSARIGIAGDSVARGILSHVNTGGSELGWTVGMSVADAIQTMARSLHESPSEPPRVIEGRHLMEDGHVRVWAVDSASLVVPDDAGHVVATGSHGGLVGGNSSRALKCKAYAAVFNDAGIGRDNAGIARLAALDGYGVPAVAVDAQTARIGDGRSSYLEGRISACNRHAISLGAEVEMLARQFVEMLVRDDGQRRRSD